jgi:DNA repair protein RadC
MKEHASRGLPVSTRKNSLACKLKYKLPRLRLCLVQEGPPGRTLQVVQTPEDAATFLEPLQHAPEEHFVSLHLNSRHEIIGLHEVSHGTLAASLVHPREVFKAALLSNSYALIVCHNHPSGSVITPSHEDIATTSQLLKSGQILGVLVIDHLIVGPGQTVYSVREHYPDLWRNC